METPEARRYEPVREVAAGLAALLGFYDERRTPSVGRSTSGSSAPTSPHGPSPAPDARPIRAPPSGGCRQPVVEPGHPGAVVDGRIRQLVRLGRLNLTSFPYRMRGPLDVIFIRNVLIYFDEPTRQQIIAECARLLRPGGLLYLGHSESAAGTRGFRQTAPSVYERC